jgi:hypothetical protein
MMRSWAIVVGCALLPGCGVALPISSDDPPTEPVLGYIASVTQMPPESAAQRAARLAIVKQRRSRGAIIVHRGDRSVAPENTLEAYAAAMDAGADGFEVDVAMSRDGVLFAFHDRTLNRSNATGHFNRRPRDVTYHQLLSVTPGPDYAYGRADADTRPPTLAAVLALARQRGALIHIDPKDSRASAQKAIARMITESGMWPHIVHVHEPYYYPHLVDHRDADFMRWKRYGSGRGVDWHRAQFGVVHQDWIDPATGEYESLRELAARGESVAPVPLPAGLRQRWGPAGPLGTPTISPGIQ